MYGVKRRLSDGLGNIGSVQTALGVLCAIGWEVTWRLLDEGPKAVGQACLPDARAVCCAVRCVRAAAAGGLSFSPRRCRCTQVDVENPMAAPWIENPGAILLRAPKWTAWDLRASCVVGAASFVF